MGYKVPDLVACSALTDAKAKIQVQRTKVLAMAIVDPSRDQQVRILGMMLANAASLETVQSLHFDLGPDTYTPPSTTTDVS